MQTSQNINKQDDGRKEATLKRVYVTSNNITLRAANPLFEDLVYQERELDQVRIIGKAVAFISQVK